MCTGMNWDEDKWASQQRFNGAGCILCRACTFKNVCLNHTSLNIQYYADGTTGPLFYDFAGNAHSSFPSDFINTGEAEVCFSVLAHCLGVILCLSMHVKLKSDTHGSSSAAAQVL